MTTPRTWHVLVTGGASQVPDSLSAPRHFNIKKMQEIGLK